MYSERALRPLEEVIPYFDSWSKLIRIYSIQMGLVESTLKPEIVKPIVRANTIKPLPSLTIDTCKFTDGSYGFLIQITDLAKNITVHTVAFNRLYSPMDTVYTYVGKDQTILTFTKDLISGGVCCILNRQNSSGPIMCDCVSVYEAIGDDRIDQIAKLYQSSARLV
jgi:hypothetical protein